VEEAVVLAASAVVAEEAVVPLAVGSLDNRFFPSKSRSQETNDKFSAVTAVLL
jgi:hypothetical protein